MSKPRFSKFRTEKPAEVEIIKRDSEASLLSHLSIFKDFNPTKPQHSALSEINDEDEDSDATPRSIFNIEAHKPE